MDVVFYALRGEARSLAPGKGDGHLVRPSEIFSNFFQKIPKVPLNPAVTLFRYPGKRLCSLLWMPEKKLKFFAGNPKVPRKAAVTGSDVAKKPQRGIDFFGSARHLFAGTTIRKPAPALARSPIALRLSDKR